MTRLVRRQRFNLTNLAFYTLTRDKLAGFDWSLIWHLSSRFLSRLVRGNLLMRAKRRGDVLADAFTRRVLLLLVSDHHRGALLHLNCHNLVVSLHLIALWRLELVDRF